MMSENEHDFENERFVLKKLILIDIEVLSNWKIVTAKDVFVFMTFAA